MYEQRKNLYRKMEVSMITPATQSFTSDYLVFMDMPGSESPFPTVSFPVDNIETNPQEMIVFLDDPPSVLIPVREVITSG